MFHLHPWEQYFLIQELLPDHILEHRDVGRFGPEIFNNVVFPTVFFHQNNGISYVIAT